MRKIFCAIRRGRLDKKGFSIPIVVSLSVFLAIIMYALLTYTSQSARNIHQTVNIKKAEYIAEAGIARAAALIDLMPFEHRLYKSTAKFAFGFVNTYAADYGGGRFSVTIVDIPAAMAAFNIDIRHAEYQGVFLWSTGTYRNVSRAVLSRYIPSEGAYRVFKYTRTINESEEYEYTNLEVN